MYFSPESADLHALLLRLSVSGVSVLQPTVATNTELRLKQRLFQRCVELDLPRCVFELLRAFKYDLVNMTYSLSKADTLACLDFSWSPDFSDQTLFASKSSSAPWLQLLVKFREASLTNNRESIASSSFDSAVIEC